MHDDIHIDLFFNTPGCICILNITRYQCFWVTVLWCVLCFDVLITCDVLNCVVLCCDFTFFLLGWVVMRCRDNIVLHQLWKLPDIVFVLLFLLLLGWAVVMCCPWWNSFRESPSEHYSIVSVQICIM